MSLVSQAQSCKVTDKRQSEGVSYLCVFTTLRDSDGAQASLRCLYRKSLLILSYDNFFLPTSIRKQQCSFILKSFLFHLCPSEEMVFWVVFIQVWIPKSYIYIQRGNSSKIYCYWLEFFWHPQSFKHCCCTLLLCKMWGQYECVVSSEDAISLNVQTTVIESTQRTHTHTQSEWIITYRTSINNVRPPAEQTLLHLSPRAELNSKFTQLEHGGVVFFSFPHVVCYVIKTSQPLSTRSDHIIDFWQMLQLYM